MNPSQLAWIDVVDSAVKIGLGAIIAAVSAFFMLKRSHIVEFQKELRNKRWAILQEVAELVQKAYETHLDHVQAFTTLKLLDESTSQDARDAAKARLNSVTTRLDALMKSLSAAEAKLLLIGEKEAGQKCRLFGDSILMDLAHTIDQFTGTRHDDPKYAHDPESRRADVFDCLSSLYRKM